MLSIGITQRVEELADRNERRDCLDQAWTSLLRDLGVLPIPLPNLMDDVAGLISGLRLQGIILSGGNDLSCIFGGTNMAAERDALESRLLAIGGERDIPVLGVCRGLQMMASEYGAELVPTPGHAAVPHPITVLEPTGLALASRQAVNSFHRYGLQRARLGSELIPVAQAPDGSIEAIRHRSRRQAAIMWHPERPPHDVGDAELIRAFFDVDRP